MIEVIARSFGLTGRQDRNVVRKTREYRNELAFRNENSAAERDLFDLARAIAFRARKRRVQSSGII